MKTPLTIEMETSLYQYCIEQGGIVVEEVTMPDDHGIVDTLSCLTKFDGTREWRCYELKVSKADFRSTAKLSFVGNYNYFVLPQTLFDEVKAEIPTGIGVLVYRPYGIAEEMPASGTFIIAKKAMKQPLAVAEEALLNRFMASLFREVRKAKQMERGVKYFPTDQLYKELKNVQILKIHLPKSVIMNDLLRKQKIKRSKIYKQKSTLYSKIMRICDKSSKLDACQQSHWSE